jgi:uncharacterized membrane protein YbhN (UPF0104 family)
MLRAMGQDVSFLAAFPSFVVLSMVATFSLVPLGRGTFEATCVAMLKTLGVPLEAAPTATCYCAVLRSDCPMLGLPLAGRELS